METFRRRLFPRSILALALAFLLLAALFPPPAAPASAAPASALTAIDVPESARATLDELGIAYQDPPRAGAIRAAANAGQLAALGREGITYTTVGKVAIFESSRPPGEASSAWNTSCYASNTGTYAISTTEWTYVTANTTCYAAGTVELVDVRFVLYNVYAEAQPPAGRGLLEIGVVVGASWPYWDYETYEVWDEICAPDAPERAGALELVDQYDRWVTGITKFNGRPLNNAWSLAAHSYCPHSPQAYVLLFQLWAYYTAPPTATPTRTPTHTPTYTPRPTYTPTRRVTATRTRTPMPGGPRKLWLPLVLTKH